MLSVLLLAWSLVAHAAPSAIACAGDAPDDGPGVHIDIGEPAVSGTRVKLGLAQDALVPGVHGLSQHAEAMVCAADGACVVPPSGTVVLDAVTAAGLRGRYTLDLADGPLSGEFVATWCGGVSPLRSVR